MADSNKSGTSWTKTPAGAESDSRLQDGEYRTLAKLCALAWEGEPDQKTPALHWREFVERLSISKATYFRHVHLLEATGYIRTDRSGDRIMFAILTGETVRPSPPPPPIGERTKITRGEGGGVLMGETVRMLQKAGIGEPLRSELAADAAVTPEYLNAHIRYSELLDEPVRFLAQRLKMRDPVPQRELDELLDAKREERRFWRS